MDEQRAKIRQALNDFWTLQDPLEDGDGTIDSLVSAMDSFTACEVLHTLEQMLGVELPSGDLVRPGGYDSKEQFVEELGAAIEAYVAERRP